MLNGRRALVTGANTGIGRAIALRLALNGCKVAIHYNSGEAGAKGVKAAIGSRAETFQCDLLDADARKDLVERSVDWLDGLDILVNNAGAAFEHVEFLALSKAAWRDSFSLNVDAPFDLIRAAWPYMQGANGGRIVNISSNTIKHGGSARNVHYASAKAAMEMMSRAIAKTGADDNILVNAIRCGVIQTDMHTRIPGYDEEQFASRLKLIPAGRAGTPDEVAKMVLFLVSDGGDFINGQVFTIAGGE